MLEVSDVHRNAIAHGPILCVPHCGIVFTSRYFTDSDYGTIYGDTPIQHEGKLMNRVAIKANRGKLYKDPMLFAITDMTSE
jgi:hypothetical protein